MPGTNQFLPFAVGAGANTLTPTAYAALTSLLSSGFASGVANSAQFNTALRQATTAAAGLAQFIANQGGSANDDGSATNFASGLLAALQSLFAGKMSTIQRNSGDAALLLDRFDVMHQYVTNGSNSVNVTTQLVDGGVYEVLINSQANGGATDYVPLLRPNNTSYSNQFTTNVVEISGAAGSAPTVNASRPVDSLFSTDALAGTTDIDGFTRITIFPSASLPKKALFHSGSSLGSSICSGYWNNTSTQWLTVGQITLYSPASMSNPGLINSVVTVRRIG